MFRKTKTSTHRMKLAAVKKLLCVKVFDFGVTLFDRGCLFLLSLHRSSYTLWMWALICNLLTITMPRKIMFTLGSLFLLSSYLT